jgi:predicted TIM-barrel fold metal-dependent hydrolase
MLSPNIKLTATDKAIYLDQLKNFLPARIVDLHSHIWLKSFKTTQSSIQRGAQWASKVASENSLEELLADYSTLFPDQQVISLLFGWPERYMDVEANNRWVSAQARLHQLPALLVSKPEMHPEDLEIEALTGGFMGLKPYLEFAPSHLPADEITIYDFLPQAHLEVANAHHWIVMLHLPRFGRLHDPVNLAQLLEIERNYPQVQLIIAHLGRAYCMQDLGNALETLQHTDHMLFDFSANTNVDVMLEILRAVGSQRLVFGSDMPITRMRMRRICENGSYVNLVPPGLYTGIEDDPHMREVDHAEAKHLSFFLYEELLAVRKAAELAALTESDIENIFNRNARRLFENVT